MGLFGDIGELFGAGGNYKPTQYTPDQANYLTPDADANKLMLRDAAMAAQNQQAPQSGYQYGAPTVSNATLAPAAMAQAYSGPTQLQAGQADSLGGQQAQLAAMQLAQAQGQGPSVAQQQMTLGSQQNMQGLLSAAASARGGQNPALLQRQLMEGLANSNQQNNANTGLARTQEEMNAQQAAAGTLGQSRGQYLDQASQNANLGQQAAQMLNQNSQYNAGNQNQFALQQGQMNLQNQQYNAGNQMTLAQLQGTQAMQNAQMQQGQLQINNQMQQSAQGNLLALSGQQQAGMENYAQAKQAAANTYAAQQQGISTANADFGGKLFGKGLDAAAVAISDESVKTNIDRTAVRDDVRQFMDAIDSASYEYKNPAHGEGRKWGVMAQSLQRSKAGASLVKRTDEGLAIDTRMGFGTLLAALKDVHERTKKLEGA